MLNKKTAKLINEQVTLEFYSAYLYLDFANFYTDQGLDGGAYSISYTWVKSFRQDIGVA